MAGTPFDRRAHAPRDFERYPSQVTPRRRGVISAIFDLITSPAMAFLVSFPTISYYTFAAYVNVLSPDGSDGAIMIRAGSLALAIIAWLLLPSRQTRRFGVLLLPASIFILLYSFRLLENIFLLDMEIMPGNTTVMLTFFVSTLIPAYLVATMERAIRDDEMITLLSVFAILFVVGMALNRGALFETAESRMTLDKINPISLAYVASSLLLFYMLAFWRSNRLKIEALIVVPILLLIVSYARSRGMLIATGGTLLIYVLALRGTRRIWALTGLAAAAALIAFFANPELVSNALEALNRIGLEDQSTAMRALSFQGAWDQFVANPFFGRYAIELITGYYPHNIYLESLMAVGLVGTAPFIIHLAWAFRGAIGILRESDRSFTRTFIALLFIREAIGNAASGSLWGATGFWITSFLVILMWYGRQKDMSLHYARLRQGMQRRGY